MEKRQKITREYLDSLLASIASGAILPDVTGQKLFGINDLGKACDVLLAESTNDSAFYKSLQDLHANRAQADADLAAGTLTAEQHSLAIRQLTADFREVERQNNSAHVLLRTFRHDQAAKAIVKREEAKAARRGQEATQRRQANYAATLRRVKEVGTSPSRKARRAPRPLGTVGEVFPGNGGC